MDTQQVVLGYWSIRGLAQPLRFLLNYLGIGFKEKSYTEEAEWYEKDKPAFNSKLANLPYLTVGGQTLFESEALFYAIADLAHRRDIIGRDLVTQTKV